MQPCLCVSEDYGKTFKDVTHLINHTFIQTEFGIAISPDHSGKVSDSLKESVHAVQYDEVSSKVFAVVFFSKTAQFPQFFCCLHLKKTVNKCQL